MFWDGNFSPTVYYEREVENRALHSRRGDALKSGSTRMRKTSLLYAIALSVATSAAVADGEGLFSPIDTTALDLGNRPYPYSVVGIVPGMTPDEARKVIEERTGTELSTDEIVGSVNSNTRTANYSFVRSLHTPGAMRLTQSNGTYEVFSVLLATDALDGAVLSINRRLRQSPDALPAPDALRAQLEDTYGPPSRVDMEGRSMRLTYFWADTGFIEDVSDVEEVVAEFEPSPGDVRDFRFQPCLTPEKDAEYEFKYPRREPFMPGCTARFTVSYRTGPGVAELSFELRDLELMRVNREASDQQILDYLNDTEVESSDFDL